MPYIPPATSEPQIEFRLYNSRNFCIQRDYAELVQLHFIATTQRHVKLSHRCVMLKADHNICKLIDTTFARINNTTVAIARTLTKGTINGTVNQQRRAKNPALHV